MCLELSILIGFALHYAKPFQIYITNAEYAPSNDTCEEDGILLYPCERLADTAEELQQHSFSKGIVNITLLPGNYYIINFSLFFHQKGVLELMKKSGSHQDYL